MNHEMDSDQGYPSAQSTFQQVPTVPIPCQWPGLNSSSTIRPELLGGVNVLHFLFSILLHSQIIRIGRLKKQL